jgi:hypothetical protein
LCGWSGKRFVSEGGGNLPCGDRRCCPMPTAEIYRGRLIFAHTTRNCPQLASRPGLAMPSAIKTGFAGWPGLLMWIGIDLHDKARLNSEYHAAAVATSATDMSFTSTT